MHRTESVSMQILSDKNRQNAARIEPNETTLVWLNTDLVFNEHKDTYVHRQTHTRTHARLMQNCNLV